MEAYPVHLLDTAQDYRKLFLAYLLIFDDVLDGQKLADSLSELLQTGDWRKLGGRLRNNKEEGTLELHVPAQFTAAEPAIGFSQKILDCNVDQHPLGKKLPCLSGDGTLQKLSLDMMAFTGVPGIPQSMEEVMQQNGPQLYLHVTAFVDATVVSIAWPHYLMDAMGMQALVRNWSLVVNQKAEQVAPLLGAHTDALRDAVDADAGAKEDLVLENLRLGPFGIIMLVLGLIWAKLWASKLVDKMITLSPDKLDRLCQRARKDLTGNGDADLFISEGDVVVAWAAQMLAGSLPKPQPITVASLVNARFRLSALRAESGHYVSNMLQFGYACFPAGCESESLGCTALSHRRQLAEQCTEQQMLGYFRMQQVYVAAKGKLRILFGAPGAAILMVNNLTKVNMFRSVDFSGAVLHRGGLVGAAVAEKPTRQNPPGTIVYYHPITLHRQASVLSYFRVMGRDHGGRLQLQGLFRPETWARIVEDLEKLEG